MTISPRDLFEVALIVPNLEAAMHHFHDAFGYTFSSILEGVLPMRDASGQDSSPPLRMVVSRELPYLELVEAQPGTPLAAPAGTGLHHLGYYVDDLRGETERLQALGCDLQAAGVADGQSPEGWVYVRMHDGTVVELVDRTSAPLRTMWVQGRLPDSPMARRLVPAPAGLGG